LVELEADYRDESRPSAMAATVLVERGPGGRREICERTSRRSVPTKTVAPAAALDAWSEGLGQIFRDVTADLRRAAG
jgi:hypothetical protein